MRVRHASLDIEYYVLVVSSPPPLLIEVPGIAFPDLKERAIVVYSVGDVLHRELETISLPQRLPTKHIFPLYIVTAPLENVNCWSTLSLQSASTTGDPLVAPF